MTEWGRLPIGIIEGIFLKAAFMTTAALQAERIEIPDDIWAAQAFFEEKGWGEGWRANATIGRFVQLVKRNIGGSYPGTTCKATLGWPGKYSICVGENEEASPWEPLHVERGFKADQSTVTAISADASIRASDLD